MIAQANLFLNLDVIRTRADQPRSFARSNDMVQKLEKGPVPLYFQLEQILRSQIANKEIGPNELLPTEMDLCKMYDVSRATVRQAIRALEDDDLVVREQGRGTTVIGKKISQRKVKLYSTVNDLIALGLSTHLEFVSKRKMTAPAELTTNGCCQKDEKVYLFKAIRTVEKPKKFIAIVHYYTPIHIGQDIPMKQANGKMSLMEEIEQTTGANAQSIRQEISAAAANKKLAEDLGIEVGAPVLKLKRAFLSSQKRLLQCAITFIAHPHFKYETEIVLA